jgi:drug/metabolite transporter (DMT)-like permease
MPEPRREETVAATPELGGEVAGIEVQQGQPALGPRFSQGMRYMAAGAFSFSIMSLLVKTAGQRLPSQEVVMVRAIVTLVLSAWAVRHARVPWWGSRDKRGLLILRGVVGFLALSCFYHSIVNLPLADATVIQYTNPVFAGLLAVPLLGERLRRREVLSVLVSLVGVALVMRPSFLFGQAAALDPVTVGIGLAGAVFSAPVEWLVMLGIGISTHLGQLYITHGLRMERAGRATATGYLQIVFAAIWGILFFAELPDWGTFLGAGLIVGSTLALARRPRQPAEARS